MRVSHRMIAQSISRNIRHNLRSLQEKAVQLSSGRNFTRPSQDPVGAYKVMRISGTGMMRNEQHRRNIGEGITWLTTAEDAIAEGLDALLRLKELAIYTANGTMTEEDLQAISPEIKQILDSMIGVGNSEVTGLYIFGGHQSQAPPFKLEEEEGGTLKVVYKGDEGIREIEITPEQTIPVNLTAEKVFGELITEGAGEENNNNVESPVNLFQTIIDIYDILTGNYDDGNGGDGRDKLGGEILKQIDEHQNRLLQCVAEVGSRMGRLTYTEQRLHNEHIYLRELRSKIEDIDLAEAITEVTMQENTYLAALSTGARMVYPSLVDFLR